MLRYIPHGIPSHMNDPDFEGLRCTADPREQLIKSLEKLVPGHPPKTSYDAQECHGLYSGPTSIALLFLHISRSHPHLNIKGLAPQSWANEYLSGKRTFSAVTAANCGVINEFLAFHAVHAITYFDDTMDLQKFWAALRPTVEAGEHDSDEWLYGRAGCLYLLRLVRTRSPASARAIDCMDIISKVMEPILNHGPSWPWHGKDYLGAVHGRIGIITHQQVDISTCQVMKENVDFNTFRVILSDPSKATHPVIMQSLKETLDLQDESGNWPSSIHSHHHDLVQFCHGAPGFIIALQAIEPHVSFDPLLQNRVASACKKAQQCVVEKGLLTKQPNLCHGTSGNALALPTPWREHFLDFTTAEAIDKGLKDGSYVPGDDTYGLFCGEAGRAWGWLALVSEQERGMIGFNDI